MQIVQDKNLSDLRAGDPGEGAPVVGMVLNQLRVGLLEGVLRQGGVMISDGTCADPSCFAKMPPMAVECGLGWKKVGELTYCPLHGTVAAHRVRKEAREKAAFERWKAQHKDELEKQQAAREEADAARRRRAALPYSDADFQEALSAARELFNRSM